MTPLSSPDKLRILGVHLAGVGSGLTAFVQGYLDLSSTVAAYILNLAHSGRVQGMGGAVLAKAEHALTLKGNNPAGAHGSPFILDRYGPELKGHQNLRSPAQSPKHAFVPLSEGEFWDAVDACEAPADMVIMDAPLSLPPCVTCSLPCPGTAQCSVNQVQNMMGFWNTGKKIQVKTRMPQPYLDRIFEVFGRTQMRSECQNFLGHEFLPVLGSNKSPLTARARRLMNEVRHRNPQAWIMEAHPYLGPMGWAMAMGLDPFLYRQFKFSRDSAQERSRLLLKLHERGVLSSQNGSLSGSDHRQLAHGPALFAAQMAALYGWGVAHGQVVFSWDFCGTDLNEPPILLHKDVVSQLLGFNRAAPVQ